MTLCKSGAMRIAPLALTSLLVACSSSSSATEPPAQPAPVAEAPPVAPPSAPPTPPPSVAPPSAPTTGAQVRVEFTQLPEGTYGMPQSSIRVVVANAGAEQAVDVGTLSNCTLAPAGEVTSGSLATVNCWWAGAGDTLEVIQREDAVVVTRQGADEEAGELPVTEVGRVALSGATATLAR